MTAPLILNTPSKPTSPGAATGRNQKDRRYMDTFWDIHKSPRFPRGRPWCGPREIAANTELMHEDGFCIPDLMQGEYVEDDAGNNDRAATFASVWHAPWKPLAKYFRFNYKRKTISFEYPKMRLDEQRAIDDYYAAAAKLGAQLKIRVEYNVVPDYAITAVLGEPTKFLKIAEAAMAGDPWLLGHIDEPNPVLAQILGYNQSGLRVFSYEPPEAVITPAAVMATPDSDLLKVIAEMQSQMAALQAQVLAPAARKLSHAEATRRGKEKARLAREQDRIPQDPAA